ncbi:hypothetical protein V6Z12_A06G159600 [Gossypium hirsutum]
MVTGTLKCLALFPKINSPSPKSIIYFPEPIQRKRKQAASEAVEGFNVFKSSKKALVISKDNKTDDGEDNLSREKKKINLKLESQHQFNNRLFWFFYPYLALLAKHLVLAKAATSAL